MRDFIVVNKVLGQATLVSAVPFQKTHCSNQDLRELQQRIGQIKGTAAGGGVAV